MRCCPRPVLAHWPRNTGSSPVVDPVTSARLLALLAALLAAVLAISLVPAAAAVPKGTPSEADIANSKAQERATQHSISDIEVELANLSAQSVQLQQASQAAKAAFEQARAAAENAKQEAEKAQQKATAAQQAVDKARAEMATIAQAMYQNSAGTLGDAYYLLDADTFSQAANHDHAMNIVADQADQQVRSFRAMQDVANGLQKRADEKAAEQETLMQAADVAADEAAQAAAQAESEVAAVDEQRDALLTQLAAQKKTTKGLEAQRFAALEAERIAKEKAAAEARAKAQAEAAAQAKAQAAAAAAQQAAGKPAPAPATPSGGSHKVDTSKPIIDISSWQRPNSINYDALAASVSGVIIRIGYTGTYSGSSLNKDPYFERHYAEFTKRGIPVGIYWYSCANEGDEGGAEARKALQYLGGRHLDFPIYIDVEDPKHQAHASRATLTDQTLRFAAAVRAGGYQPGVYASSSWFRSKLNHGALTGAGMAIWAAQWSSAAPSFSYSLWQYSSAGHLHGYSGRLDVNRRG